MGPPRHADSHNVPDCAELFDPRLVSIGAGTLWVRGFESTGNAGVVQEWRVDVQRPIRPGGHYGPPLGETGPSR